MNVKPIIRLDQSVVNRIAAGEVIQRPVNALKELIENSLDAHSTSINVAVKDGGLKTLQIQDNGSGIKKLDLTLICERFTTSKLRDYDDLKTISTYGFRGEALASISHIAHITITTKVANAVCAYKAEYRDGKLLDTPKPLAGNQGTIITVEDLFYNMPIRRKALRNPTEEYQKITDVLGKYAIHNSRVAFSLKKANQPIEIRTQNDSNPIDNIRIIYGNGIAKELIQFEFENDLPAFHLYTCITNPNYNTKKFQFILFINHRLVDCSNMKRAIDQMYSIYLPKGTHPFVYLSLELDSNRIDVNIHPTKHEVHFLDEDIIIQSICTVLEAKLLKCNQSRVFYTQAKLPKDFEINQQLPIKDDDKIQSYPKDKIRTDVKEQKLEKFFGTPQTNDDPQHPILCFTPQPAIFNKINRVKTELTSVQNLRKQIENNFSPTIREIFAQHVFVGLINPKQALIQYKTQLYLCNTEKILQQFFYQLILDNFSCLPIIMFEEPLPLTDLIERGLEHTDSIENNEIVQLLFEKREMFDEYFSLMISHDAKLCGLPLILDFTPDFNFLPNYLVHLATQVNWNDEEECFKTFSWTTAKFYANLTENIKSGSENWHWVIEHILYTSIKQKFLASKVCSEDGSLLEIANLPNLYKVFERC